MAFSVKRGALLFVAALLVVAATLTIPTPGHAATCPSLRCPNRTILTCTLAPCDSLDNCGIICGGHVARCPGPCIIQ